MRSTRLRTMCALAAASSLLALTVPSTAEAAVPKPQKLATKLTKKTSGRDANRHLIAFQRIADRNGGNRAAGTPGYEASVDYVAKQLRQAGYKVSTPSFDFTTETKNAESLSVGDDSYTVSKLGSSTGTSADGITAPLAVVPEDSTTGCEASDFGGKSYDGTIALIRRGGCTFLLKTQNAAEAGAIGVLVSNNTAGPVNGTLGEAASIPAGSVDQADGDSLARQDGAEATMVLDYTFATAKVRNVIAQTRTGNERNVVMSGAHLDSVTEGPGINDNGSGSAGQLEVALKLGSAPKVKNAVRFAWWAAEEEGLLGSENYVSRLSFAQSLDIALYLNFDMIASPNAAYFVYDGDDSDGEGAGAGPYGSADIEKTFANYLKTKKGLQTQGTDFDGRSDYGPFIEAGIPAGGLFSGAEGVKTQEQAALWGGSAGAAYDPCYHQKCDNLGNLDRQAFDRNIDAMAWSVGIYGYSTTGVNGANYKAAKQGRFAAARAMNSEAVQAKVKFKGGSAVR